jgi:hypothetical protein
MPIQVRAVDGDTLCGIAVNNGFRNCKKLRDANPTLANRDLNPGDQVQVPDVTPKSEAGAVDQLHPFKRLGAPVGRIFYIQDFNRATPEQALSDKQRQLAVSNYVTGRQGSGFAFTGTAARDLWRDKTFFGHDADASADPDHFKIQVFDKHAKDKGDAKLTVTLQTQRPRLNASVQIERWEDMPDAGAKVDITCQQVAAKSPWYRSHYLRVVAERDDQNNRPADVVDNGADRTAQTLVVPAPTDDRRIEILDLRVRAHKDVEDCGATGTQPKCRARALADVGKEEKALKIKVFRVDGPGNQAAQRSRNDIEQTVIPNMRLQLAQCNVALKVLEIKDVPPPRNMIAIGDTRVVKATGGKTIGAMVALASGNITAITTTHRKDEPSETAQRLAAALRAQGVQTRVSGNPPPINTGTDFGPADILCFNADGTPARVIGVTNSASENQKISSTGGWDNNNVTTPDVQYGANEPSFRFIGSADYRALLKNNFEGTDRFCAYVFNNFTQPNPAFTLLGYALIPYHEVTAKFKPHAELTLGVLISANAAQRRTVLTHEAGHALLDAIHTTRASRTPPDTDFQGNANNKRLAFSEMMTAFDSSVGGGGPQPFLHKRLSDNPLTLEFLIIHGNLQTRQEVFGQAPSLSTTQRLRSLFSAVFTNLRQLPPAPGADL